MTSLPPNGLRGIVGVIALALIFFRASALWGNGAGMLALGLALFLDSAKDEALERITLTKRGMSFE